MLCKECCMMTLAGRHTAVQGCMREAGRCGLYTMYADMQQSEFIHNVRARAILMQGVAVAAARCHATFRRCRTSSRRFWQRSKIKYRCSICIKMM
jgi:hypothetical protein